MDLDLLLDQSAPRIELTRDGLTELDRVTDLARQGYPRLARHRRAGLLAGVVGAVFLLGGLGAVAAVAAPTLFRSPPPPQAVHMKTVLDRSFTVDGITQRCQLSMIIDVPAGPDAAALRRVILDYLSSPDALTVAPDSPTLDLLLQVKDGSLGAITATTYAGAWGYALTVGLDDNLKATGLDQNGLAIESGAVCK